MIEAIQVTTSQEALSIIGRAWDAYHTKDILALMSIAGELSIHRDDNQFNSSLRLAVMLLLEDIKPTDGYKYPSIQYTETATGRFNGVVSQLQKMGR